MKLSEIIHVVEKTAPKTQAAPWDNCGVQVAPAAPLDRTEVTHVALCLDPTPQSVRTALDSGAQCVFSHHPLLMQPRLPAKADAYHRVLSLLFHHNATLYAAHTSLDINPFGPAGWLARELQLTDTALLDATGILPEECAPHAGKACGFGLVGTLPQPLSLEEVLRQLAQHISLDAATQCGPLPKHISRVAYCTGSGASLMNAAARLEADIFITGDVKYHNALESPLCMLDVGHHSLEEEMMRRFATQLASELPDVCVDFVPSVSPLRAVTEMSR